MTAPTREQILRAIAGATPDATFIRMFPDHIETQYGDQADAIMRLLKETQR